MVGATLANELEHWLNIGDRMEELECTECGWQGWVNNLLCSTDDEDKPLKDITFDICPDCGGKDCFEDIID